MIKEKMNHYGIMELKNKECQFCNLIKENFKLEYDELIKENKVV